jgi:cyclopropane fatty-acyl-phospholipid synthase-like methyltransferase
MAMKLGIQPGDVVLDVGCGVGGPAREIAMYTDCNVVGLNNNDYQYLPSSIALTLELIVQQYTLPNRTFPNTSPSSKEIS